MTSDAALVFSSCPDNTTMVGLRQYRCTIGWDPAGVFCIAVHHVYVENALAPYSYPRVLQHIVCKALDFWTCSHRNLILHWHLKYVKGGTGVKRESELDTVQGNWCILRDAWFLTMERPD